MKPFFGYTHGIVDRYRILYSFTLLLIPLYPVHPLPSSVPLWQKEQVENEHPSHSATTLPVVLAILFLAMGAESGDGAVIVFLIVVVAAANGTQARTRGAASPYKI